MAVNINRDVQDAFYRYKMPRLQSKIEGKGNGIKTVVVNIEEVARSLSRPPSYATKFFGCELGAQTIMDEKASRYIVNGAHDTSRLVELLDLFIKKFVLCASCGNPETVMVIDRKQIIHLDCKACGHKGRVDMNHKLITFILRNPPAATGGTATVAAVAAAGGAAGAKKKTKEERRKEKAARNSGAGGGGHSRRASDEDDEDDNTAAAGEDLSSSNGATPLSSRTASASAASDANGNEEDNEDDESGLQFTQPLVVEGGQADAAADTAVVDEAEDQQEDDEEDFSSDTLALAEALKKQQLSDMNEGIRRLLANDDKASDKAADPAGQFAEAVGRDGVTAAEMTAAYERLKLRADRAAAVAVQVMFAEDLVAELPKRAAVLQQFIKSEAMQLGLLGGLERLISSKKEWMRDLNRVLKFFYDRDMVDEEVFFKWADSTTNDYVKPETAKAIRAHAKQFIDWLRTAEEESDSE